MRAASSSRAGAATPRPYRQRQGQHVEGQQRAGNTTTDGRAGAPSHRHAKRVGGRASPGRRSRVNERSVLQRSRKLAAPPGTSRLTALPTRHERRNGPRRPAPRWRSAARCTCRGPLSAFRHGRIAANQPGSMSRKRGQPPSTSPSSWRGWAVERQRGHNAPAVSASGSSPRVMRWCSLGARPRADIVRP